MNCSRKFIQFRIKIVVLLTRLAGRLQGLHPTSCKAKGDLRKAKLLTDYFGRKHLPAVAQRMRKEETTTTPETIWQFWDNPAGQTTPGIVEAALSRVHAFKGSLEHRVLDSTTMASYSDLPGYVLDKFKKGQIDHTHFSDLLRLNLLKNHGGIWLDATGYMTGAIPQYILDEEFFLFHTGTLTFFPYSFIQSCFIRTRKGNLLCDAWYEMCVDYWKKGTKKLDYFQIHLMFKALVEQDPTAGTWYKKMPYITEDGIQQLIGDKLLSPFNINEWNRIKQASFFQKTTYKVPRDMDDTGTYFSALSKGQL